MTMVSMTRNQSINPNQELRDKVLSNNNKADNNGNLERS